MDNMNWLLHGIIWAVIFIVGFGCGMYAVKHLNIAGTLIINMSRDDKDIAQFVFDKDLEEISNKTFITVNIKKNDKLKSLVEYEDSHKLHTP